MSPQPLDNIKPDLINTRVLKVKIAKNHQKCHKYLNSVFNVTFSKEPKNDQEKCQKTWKEPKYHQKCHNYNTWTKTVENWWNIIKSQKSTKSATIPNWTKKSVTQKTAKNWWWLKSARNNTLSYYMSFVLVNEIVYLW